MDTAHLLDTTCLASDSGIGNCSVASINSSVLLNNATTAQSITSEPTSALDLTEVRDDIIQDDEMRIENDHKRISKRIVDSTSTFELVDFQDEDQSSVIATSSRDINPPNELNLNQRHGSQSSTKTCEIDLHEERDTFSPVSAGYSSDQPPDDGCINVIDYTDVDNKISDMRKIKSTSTKEEKQRQNEEIVIMETSSISSETGSWESVFPHRINVDIKDSCRNFLQNERSNCVNCSDVPLQSNCLDQSEFISHPSSSVAACFIDASTLLDESEIVYPSLAPQLPDIGCFSPKPSGSKIDISKNHILNEKSPDKSEDSDKEAWPKNKHLEKLETFHRSFELCKGKPLTKVGSNSSSSEESPQKGNSSEENTNNLSDEEKLWKRENSRKSVDTRIDVKDQYVSQDLGNFQDFFKTSPKQTENLSRQGTFDLDENEIVRLRKNQERKQGNLVFQNSIQQFSGHLISPKMPFSEENFNEFSASPTIAWSENENYKQNYDSSSNFGDASDCGESTSSRFQSESETPMSCIIPDTPHNSIMQVDANERQNDKDTSYGTDSEHLCGIKIPKRCLRCDDSAPIISGGVSIKDFTPKQCDSPPVRRKTETCPILSGGVVSLDFKLENDNNSKIKEKSKLLGQPTTSWIVDMSDCKNRRRRSTSSSSSTENTTRSVDNSIERNGSGSSQKSGLGFYVSLNDMDPHKNPDSNGTRKLSKSLHESVKKATGFYVDISESENSRNATPPPSTKECSPAINGINGDKKNIFSMFIDFGDKKNTSKREPLSLASRLSNSLYQKKDTDSMKTSSSSTETLMSRSVNNSYISEKLDSAGETGVTSSDESKRPSYLFTENESPVIRRTTNRLLEKDESKRHSWNTSDGPTAQFMRREHKRSASLTADKGIMNILDKIPLISKTSSMSIDSSLSPFDDFTCSKSEISTYSNNSNSITSNSVHSSVGENDAISRKIKKRRRDVQINETFDKSSQGSLTDGVFSKESSPISTTDTDDLTFQQEENLCLTTEPISIKENNNRSLVMETIIETKETSSPKKQQLNNNAKQKIVNGFELKTSAHTMETLHATIEKQKQLLETVTEHVETNSNFVKLSDMDKPITKFELHSPESMMSKSVGSRHISKLFQDSKIRPHSWTMTRSTGNSIMNITSSVENLKSLTRLFPHLSKELSNSLPGDVLLDVYNRSPNEHTEYIHSDFSNESSLASSISRSGMDESSISCRQPRRLGEDLLKMFLQEIATDVIVEVNGRRIKAHKCILRSRCQYFAAMLAGGWVQSAGNVISLPGYSYSSVHFALCHIYSGASHPPDGISLMELAALADLLGLEGLKEVTAHALKMNYCHNFHKPCSGCIDGILQVLPVALNHALDDLYRKCLKWTCRYYLKVWPTRSFAQLPSDIFSRCRQQLVAHLTSESVLESILDCDHLISQLAPCRWAAAIENLVRDILDCAYNYISDHFASLIASDCFLSLGHDKCLNISRLESILLRTASSLTPDQACRSYQRVTRLNAVLAAKIIKVPNINENNHEFGDEVHEEEMEWNEEFVRLVSAILSAVEQCLTRQCARAMRVTAWQRMDLELRKKIQKLACLTEPLDLRRGKPVSKQISFNTNNRTQDLYQVKLAIQAHSKRALAQDSQLYRATAHTQTHTYDRNIQTNEKAVQANNEIKDTTGKQSKPTNRIVTTVINVVKPKIEKTKILGHRRTQSEDTSTTKKQECVSSKAPARLSEIRPRYLEPRKPRMPLKSQTSSNIPSMKSGKHISSSDSSRTSSPAQGKRLSANVNRKIGLKSINMSLDSLASPSKRSEKCKDKIDTEISIDSLADSMKSSMKTDKTISQESLARCDPHLKEVITIKNNKISRSNPIINKENQLSKVVPNKMAKNKSLSCQTTSGSSPSSITNKSSRLSSTTSSVNSPRDAFKNRSISVPAGQTTGVRRSFLSAKSREILARKSATISNTTINHTSKLAQEKTSPTSTVNKSISSSNIPTRRTIPPTTLHLRRTAKLMSNTVASPTKSSQLKTVSKSNNIVKTFNNKNEKLVKHLSDNKKENHEKIELVIESPKDLRVESKLERSSTFCKETSDLPAGELQVIE